MHMPISIFVLKRDRNNWLARIARWLGRKDDVVEKEKLNVSAYVENERGVIVISKWIKERFVTI